MLNFYALNLILLKLMKDDQTSRKKKKLGQGWFLSTLEVREEESHKQVILQALKMQQNVLKATQQLAGAFSVPHIETLSGVSKSFSLN